MACRIFQTLKMASRVPSASPNSQSTWRHLATTAEISKLNSKVETINTYVSPSIVTLKSTFPTFPSLSGSAVFLDRDLIVTSAHLIARLDSLQPHIATTTVSSPITGPVNHDTTPLAINFSHDIAVLQVLRKPEYEHTLFPKSVLVGESSPPVRTGDFLVNIGRFPEQTYSRGGTVSSVGGVLRAKAPYPLGKDKEVNWVEVDCLMLSGDPKLGCSLSEEEGGLGRAVGSVAGVCGGMGGSPWYNLLGEVVGLNCWEVRKTDVCVGYAVPAVCIKMVLEYAKGKGPDDPVVMDGPYGYVRPRYMWRCC